MSKQNTVPCPTCKSTGGKTIRTPRQATDRKGRTVTVYDSSWKSCGTCTGTGQITGGRG
ncbi:hypothetical protein [Streptomyces sp. DSM 40484]|uniref:hypothetical protein n=1 Tax=Streptomyces kroppenstedtii TaxID=3051181 RepID=UPI0028D3CA91|nr:hypothetical protein [Streptomyces sp. DSM 40484]